MHYVVVAGLALHDVMRLSATEFAAVLSGCSPRVRHRFGGGHALGGAPRGGLRRCSGRFGRPRPHLQLTTDDVLVECLPHDTAVIVRWPAQDILPDGSPSRDRRVHIIRLRRFKVVNIDAHGDSQAVPDKLVRQAEMGITEASAAAMA